MVPGSVTFAGASVVRDYPYPGNDTLVLAVRPSLSVVGGTSRVCTYSISDINTVMDNSLTECAYGEDRRVVWDGSTPYNMRGFCSLLSVSFVTHTYKNLFYYL